MSNNLDSLDLFHVQLCVVIMSHGKSKTTNKQKTYIDFYIINFIIDLMIILMRTKNIH